MTDTPQAAERTTDFMAKNNAVMTDEVGIITGEVTLQTQLDDKGGVVQRVQYKDADEWYRLTGAPTSLPPGQSLDDLHEQTVTGLRES